MPDTASVILQPFGKVVRVSKNSTVLAAIREAGIQFESICGGKGECNKCKVIYLRGSCDIGSPGSIKGLSDEEIKDRYCRACQTHISGDCEFSLPIESRIDTPKILLDHAGGQPDLTPSVAVYRVATDTGIVHPFGHRSLRLEGYTGTRPHMTREQQEFIRNAVDNVMVTITRTNGFPEVLRIDPAKNPPGIFGIAIDMGTTTVAGALINLSDGTLCARASVLNCQITYGEELLTRISYAREPAGKADLQSAAVKSINMVIRQLIADAGIPASSIDEITLAGNTVMTYQVLGRDSYPLEMVNADIPRMPAVVRAQSLSITSHPSAYLYCLPAVSRFIGGDAVGDVVVTGMHRSPELSLLIDLGTNGEGILGNSDWLVSVSCASGPAFEGAGITAGMRAMRGAIDHVSFDPAKGTFTWTTIGGMRPRGICGSGIIDAAAAMVSAGILDFTGKIVGGKPGVRDSGDERQFVLVPAKETATGRDIVITRQDMAYLMDSKAATCGAIGVLLKKYRIAVGAIRHVYLAGAFGAYTDRQSIITLGIIPDFYHAVYHPVGNGSLAGAIATLISQKMRDEALGIAKKMVYIDLMVDADFIEEYSSALYIPGKKEYFPV